MTELQTNLGNGSYPAGGAGNTMPGPEDQRANTPGSGTKGPARFQIPGAGGLVLVGLFLAGITGLYVLSLSSGPASASASDADRLVEARIDSVLSELDGPASSTPTP